MSSLSSNSLGADTYLPKSTKFTNKAFSFASHGVSTLRELFLKLSDSTASLTKTDSDKLSISRTDSGPKSKWRPSLKLICNDKELLNALILFMTKHYNEENILFLQSVNKLNNDINNLLLFATKLGAAEETAINTYIDSIYKQYIVFGAEKQINLSSNCFNHIMCAQKQYKEYTLDQKKSLFSICFAEINHLISTSILASFYNANTFQSIAKSRCLLDSNKHKAFISESSDGDTDDEHETKNDCNVQNVSFDVNCAQYIVSSKGFESGYHEWQIQIMEWDGDRIEFGVIGDYDKDIMVNEYGIRGADALGSRAIYGYNKSWSKQKFFYASYNDDNTIRCHKDLSSLHIHQKSMERYDVVKICLNLNKRNIKFYLNNQKVRKTISIQRNTYYPVISYSGSHCKFRVIE